MDDEQSLEKIEEQRKKDLRIFSKFYDGIVLSPVMRYSVTREKIALRIARWAKSNGYKYVVDACGGAGGNSIAFARQGMKVAYVDINNQNLEDAMNNAKVYDVFSDIYFHLGNIFEFDALEDAGLDPRETLLFCSPEWGGPNYKRYKYFNLEQLNPPLSKIINYAKAEGYPELCVYAPRNTDRRQAEELGCVRIQYMFLEKWCDSACLWFKFD